MLVAERNIAYKSNCPFHLDLLDTTGQLGRDPSDKSILAYSGHFLPSAIARSAFCTQVVVMKAQIWLDEHQTENKELSESITLSEEMIDNLDQIMNLVMGIAKVNGISGGYSDPDDDPYYNEDDVWIFMWYNSKK